MEKFQFLLGLVCSFLHFSNGGIFNSKVSRMGPYYNYNLPPQIYPTENYMRLKPQNSNYRFKNIQNIVPTMSTKFPQKIPKFIPNSSKSQSFTYLNPPPVHREKSKEIFDFSSPQYEQYFQHEKIHSPVKKVKKFKKPTSVTFEPSKSEHRDNYDGWKPIVGPKENFNSYYTTPNDDSYIKNPKNVSIDINTDHFNIYSTTPSGNNYVRNPSSNNFGHNSPYHKFPKGKKIVRDSNEKYRTIVENPIFRENVQNIKPARPVKMSPFKYIEPTYAYSTIYKNRYPNDETTFKNVNFYNGIAASESGEKEVTETPVNPSEMSSKNTFNSNENSTPVVQNFDPDINSSHYNKSIELASVKEDFSAKTSENSSENDKNNENFMKVGNGDQNTQFQNQNLNSSQKFFSQPDPLLNFYQPNLSPNLNYVQSPPPNYITNFSPNSNYVYNTPPYYENTPFYNYNQPPIAAPHIKIKPNLASNQKKNNLKKSPEGPKVQKSQNAQNVANNAQNLNGQIGPISQFYANEGYNYNPNIRNYIPNQGAEFGVNTVTEVRPITVTHQSHEFQNYPVINYNNNYGYTNPPITYQNGNNYKNPNVFYHSTSMPSEFTNSNVNYKESPVITYESGPYFTSGQNGGYFDPSQIYTQNYGGNNNNYSPMYTNIAPISAQNVQIPYNQENMAVPIASTYSGQVVPHFKTEVKKPPKKNIKPFIAPQNNNYPSSENVQNFNNHQRFPQTYVKTFSNIQNNGYKNIPLIKYNTPTPSTALRSSPYYQNYNVQNQNEQSKNFNPPQYSYEDYETTNIRSSSIPPNIIYKSGPQNHQVIEMEDYDQVPFQFIKELGPILENDYENYEQISPPQKLVQIQNNAEKINNKRNSFNLGDQMKNNDKSRDNAESSSNQNTVKIKSENGVNSKNGENNENFSVTVSPIIDIDLYNHKSSYEEPSNKKIANFTKLPPLVSINDIVNIMKITTIVPNFNNTIRDKFKRAPNISETTDDSINEEVKKATKNLLRKKLLERVRSISGLGSQKTGFKNSNFSIDGSSSEIIGKNEDGILSNKNSEETELNYSEIDKISLESDQNNKKLESDDDAQNTQNLESNEDQNIKNSKNLLSDEAQLT